MCARGSMDRASDSGSGGWGFESLRARQIRNTPVGMDPRLWRGFSAEWGVSSFSPGICSTGFAGERCAQRYQFCHVGHEKPAIGLIAGFLCAEHFLCNALRCKTPLRVKSKRLRKNANKKCKLEAHILRSFYSVHIAITKKIASLWSRQSVANVITLCDGLFSYYGGYCPTASGVAGTFWKKP